MPRAQAAEPSPGSIEVTADVVVSRSNDEDCPVGKKGVIAVRRGKPVPYLVFKVCGHRHVYTPAKLLSTPVVDVKMRLDSNG